MIKEIILKGVSKFLKLLTILLLIAFLVTYVHQTAGNIILNSFFIVVAVAIIVVTLFRPLLELGEKKERKKNIINIAELFLFLFNFVFVFVILINNPTIREIEFYILGFILLLNILHSSFKTRDNYLYLIKK